MYRSMKILIGKRYYKTEEETQKKLDVFFAVGRLTGEEYAALTTLARTVYQGLAEE